MPDFEILPDRPPPGTIDQGTQHFSRVKRKSMVRMAQACRLDVKRWAEVADVNWTQYDLKDPSGLMHCWNAVARQIPAPALLLLWTAISEAISGGVPHPDQPIEGDPYAFFLTGTCTAEHGGRGPYQQIATIKTGYRVEQSEAEKMMAYLRAQEQVNTCELCGEKITVWSAETTRVSTFAAKQRVGTPMASPIRGA